MNRKFSEKETLLVELGRGFYARGWVLGTSGNFSAVVSHDPFCMAITSTGLDKGSLTPDQLVRVDANGTVTEGSGQPSAETALHLLAVCVFQDRGLVHTHSAWGTMIFDLLAVQGGIWVAS